MIIVAMVSPRPEDQCFDFVLDCGVAIDRSRAKYYTKQKFETCLQRALPFKNSNYRATLPPHANCALLTMQQVDCDLDCYII